MNDKDQDTSVRLWLVVESDRGMGSTVCAGYATEAEADAACGSNEYAEWVDIPWSRLDSLRPNAGGEN